MLNSQPPLKEMAIVNLIFACELRYRSDFFKVKIVKKSCIRGKCGIAVHAAAFYAALYYFARHAEGLFCSVAFSSAFRI